MVKGLIILDRDGVLNKMVVDPEHGTIDSPLHESQVQIFSWVPECLNRITTAGYKICIATNQPAAAKLKTTRENLVSVHHQVLKLASPETNLIHSSHICFHRAEDKCECRKPKTGLLAEAAAQFPTLSKDQIWMVGDGVTDVGAGQNFGIKTAFLGPRKTDAIAIFVENGLQPDFWGANLLEFTNFLTKLRQ